MQANARNCPSLMRLSFIGAGQRMGYTLMEADGVVLAGKLQWTASLLLGNAR